jgi:nicotinamidase-related amidase
MTKPFSAITDPVVQQLAEQWAEHLTSTDMQVVGQAGYGRDIEPGHSPALVLVDFQYAYVGDDAAILDQLKRWPTAGGRPAWNAVRRTLPVLDAARLAGIPIVFSRIGYPAADAAASPFAAKRGSSSAFVLGDRGTEIVEDLRRQDGETLITKTAASAFYLTDLEALLGRHEVDTLLVCGLSTSGCVRATVVDAAARGYRAVTIADCVADRISCSHDIALFDIWLKYGALTSAAAAVGYLSTFAITSSAMMPGIGAPHD